MNEKNFCRDKSYQGDFNVICYKSGKLLPMQPTKLLVTVCSFLLLVECGPAFGGTLPDTAYDRVYAGNIKSVLLYKDGWELSYPMMMMGAGEKLVLSFDELNRNLSEFTYAIRHCNANWTLDDLEEYEFMDTPGNKRITDRLNSFSTYVPYVHYELKFPNDEWDFHKSGNYIIYVYEDGRKEPVISKRFMVNENLTGIKVTLKRPSAGEVTANAQSLDITLDTRGTDDQNFNAEPVLNVMQNGNWNSLELAVPSIISGGTSTEFLLDGKYAFAGTNEFRNFDIKNVKYLSPNLQYVTYLNNVFNVGLHPDKPRTFKDYFFDNDLDGKYLIKVQDGNNSNTDADYVNVFFTLPWAEPVIDGKIYVTGALGNWRQDTTTQMTYNYKSRSYELTMLLKQGYYNYMYAMVKKGKAADFSFIEGSHYETENDYLIMVYYHDSQKEYDHLTGLQLFNTIAANAK